MCLRILCRSGIGLRRGVWPDNGLFTGKETAGCGAALVRATDIFHLWKAEVVAADAIFPYDCFIGKRGGVRAG